MSNYKNKESELESIKAVLKKLLIIEDERTRLLNMLNSISNGYNIEHEIRLIKLLNDLLLQGFNDTELICSEMDLYYYSVYYIPEYQKLAGIV